MSKRELNDGVISKIERQKKKKRTELQNHEVVSETIDDGWDSKAGRIIRVRMRNFMNHSEFEYRPTERLNFLNGSNGSGKSAVLTAIVFGLGGSARMSNRGAGNTGLIRQGQASATVEISLYNGGEHAFKEEIYGDAITVVRTVLASGGGGYRLKDAKGRIVKEKKTKEELDKILYSFGIQVDNPIAILNQDAAKTFLYKCEPARLYEFFMKASRLEECKQDYNSANFEKEAAKVLLEDKMKSLIALKAEVKKWKKKFEYHQLIEKKRNELEPLKVELAWSMVRILREDYSKTEENVEVFEKKIEHCSKKIEEEIEKQKEMKKEKMEVEKEIQEVAMEADKAEEAADELRRSARLAREAEKNTHKSVQDFQRQTKVKTDQVEALQSAILKIQSGESEQEYKQAEERKQEEIERLENEKVAMEAQIATREIHVVNLRKSITTTSETEQELRAKLTETNTLLERKTRELKGLEKRRSNKLSLFGEKMPELVFLINSNVQRFKTLPIGPIGFFIELAKDVLSDEAAIIENELRSSLCTFLVSSFEDGRIVKAMATRCRIRIKVITMHFSDQLYDVTAGKCSHAKYKTILDRVVITNPNITNHLIDALHIEKVLLISDESSALDLLKDVGTVPKNCKYALTFNYSQCWPAPNCRFYSTKSGKSSNRVLQSSLEHFVAKLKLDCVSFEQILKEGEKQLGEIRVTKREHNKELSEAESESRSLRQNIVKVGNQLERIRSESSTLKPPDISALEEDKDKLEEDLVDLNEKLNKWTEQHNMRKEESEKIQQTLSEKEEEIQTQVRQTDPLVEKLSSIEKTLLKFERNKEHFVKKTKEYKKCLKETQILLSNKKTKLDLQVTKAEKRSETEVSTNRKPEVILREIIILEESQKRLVGDEESKEEVVKKYEEVSLFHAQVKHQVDTFIETLENLDRMLKIRKTGFMSIRASVGRNIQMNFSTRLQTRKFVGELIFQHKSNLLDICVSPQGVNNTQKSDLKNLSGGEKSYATISLILAMWDAIQPPFRCLDEFDVFMDSVNRRIAIDQITTYAKETRKFQYILLTPLSVESVTDDKDIQVVQLQKNN